MPKPKKKPAKPTKLEKRREKSKTKAVAARFTKIREEAKAEISKLLLDYANSLGPTERAVFLSLGSPGRMISWSKGDYQKRHPTHVPVFNANVFVVDDGQKRKLWHGDLDLTLDEEKIKALAKELKNYVYVLREMDGRFENEQEPRLDRHVYCAGQGGFSIGNHPNITRATSGPLSGKIVWRTQE